MKKLFLLLMLSLPIALGAQTLKSTGTTAEGVLPDGWTAQYAYGDMNKDGVRDLALIAFAPEDKAAPLLAVYWGERGGNYRLWRQYPDKLLANEEFCFYEYSIDITAKGVMKISVNTFMSAGGWGNNDDTYLFRYQQGDFFLIGQDSQSVARNTHNAEKVSINYLTHKKQELEYNIDDNRKPKERWSRIPKEPLQSLSDWGM